MGDQLINFICTRNKWHDSKLSYLRRVVFGFQIKFPLLWGLQEERQKKRQNFLPKRSVYNSLSVFSGSSAPPSPRLFRTDGRTDKMRHPEDQQPSCDICSSSDDPNISCSAGQQSAEVKGKKNTSGKRKRREKYPVSLHDLRVEISLGCFFFFLFF